MMEKLFNKGFTFLSFDGQTYEKLDDNSCSWWVCTNSKYLVGNELRPETEKPLYDDKGRLNRYGWKWPDQQVKDYYKL